MSFIARVWTVAAVVCLIGASCRAEDIAQHLQDISVTVKSPSGTGGGEGSGVIVTREIKLDEKSKERIKINFVWTAAHVVDNLRSVRNTIKNGTEKKVIEFRDAQIVKELVQSGRRVGELKMDARVLYYSDADDGEDLALLMIRKTDFVSASAQFHLEEEKQIPIGTQLFHVGSLLGQTGSNSMTTGIMSQIGRVVEVGSGDGTVFDQTTVTAFPGSSGGGVFLAKDGKYIGMLVRGAGETFNLLVPIRRMHKWAHDNDLLWALDDKVEAPTLEELKAITPGMSDDEDDDKSGTKKGMSPDFPFRLHYPNQFYHPAIQIFGSIPNC